MRNTGSREKRLDTHGQTEKQNKRDRSCPEDAFVFILLPAYRLFLSSHTGTSSSLAFSHSLNLSFSTPHSHVWEDSCAAAAILNYIGQWEIVFAVILCLMFIQKLQSSKNISKSTRECRGEKKMQINPAHQQTHTCKLIMVAHTTYRDLYGSHRSRTKSTTKNTHKVTKQVSRTSCDKDTIESGEKEKEYL